MTEIADIQKPFAKWLRERGLPFVQARSDKRSTVASGWPDFTICYGGRVLLIECKTGKGKPSPDQVKKISELRCAGNRVEVTYCLEECISAAQTWMDGSKASTEAPAREKQPSTDGLRIVQWRGTDMFIVVDRRGPDTDFVRLARPDDLLSIPRA